MEKKLEITLVYSTIIGLMTTKPSPFKGLRIRVSMIVPTKERGLFIRGLG